MAEVLHRSHGASPAPPGVHGPMAFAAPAQHAVLVPQAPPYPSWVPASPNPHHGFAVDPGVRHKQVG